MVDDTNIQDLRNRAAALVRDVTPAISRMIDEAYERGRGQGYSEGFAAGKHEAGQELLKFVASMNTDHILAVEPGEIKVTGSDVRVTVTRNSDGEKLPPGTVKPTVLKTIQEFPEGISIRDIEKLTGFKHSSVRGTVWNLQNEGFVKKGDGNLWVPVDVSKDTVEQEVLNTVLKHEDGSQEQKDVSDMFN